MVRIALVGLGKMGISHLAIARAHRDIDVTAACDATGYMRDILEKYTGLRMYSDYNGLLADNICDAVIIATPSRLHGPMVQAALERGLHVFCEKQFCLDSAEGMRLARLATDKGLVNQVGYHYRFVGAFKEAKRHVDSGVLGRIHNVRAEAYGPVVLRENGATWRTRKSEGGGCLYDYACHAVDVLQFLAGPVEQVSGAVLNRVFSRDVDDGVYATLHFGQGATGQLAANWSDESFRKMSLKVTIWGTNGRMTVDRQEVQLYVQDPALGVGVKPGWNISYTTELTDNVDYYLRGEEYSAQIDHFVQCIETNQTETVSSFLSASITDRVLTMMQENAGRPPLSMSEPAMVAAAVPRRAKSLFSRAATILSVNGDAR